MRCMKRLQNHREALFCQWGIMVCGVSSLRVQPGSTYFQLYLRYWGCPLHMVSTQSICGKWLTDNTALDMGQGEDGYMDQMYGYMCHISWHKHAQESVTGVRGVDGCRDECHNLPPSTSKTKWIGTAETLWEGFETKSWDLISDFMRTSILGSIYCLLCTGIGHTEVDKIGQVPAFLDLVGL